MRRFPPTHPLHLVLGLTLWSAWFVAIYGGMSVACVYVEPAAERGPLNLLNLILLLSAVALTALLLAAARRGWRSARELRNQPDAPRQHHFMALVGAAMYLWSAPATLAVALPLLVVPACV